MKQKANNTKCKNENVQVHEPPIIMLPHGTGAAVVARQNPASSAKVQGYHYCCLQALSLALDAWGHALLHVHAFVFAVCHTLLTALTDRLGSCYPFQLRLPQPTGLLLRTQLGMPLPTGLLLHPPAAHTYRSSWMTCSTSCSAPSSLDCHCVTAAAGTKRWHTLALVLRTTYNYRVGSTVVHQLYSHPLQALAHVGLGLAHDL